MSNYLNNLVASVVHPGGDIQPRLPGRFVPAHLAQVDSIAFETAHIDDNDSSINTERIRPIAGDSIESAPPDEAADISAVWAAPSEDVPLLIDRPSNASDESAATLPFNTGSGLATIQAQVSRPNVGQPQAEPTASDVTLASATATRNSPPNDTGAETGDRAAVTDAAEADLQPAATLRAVASTEPRSLPSVDRHEPPAKAPMITSMNQPPLAAESSAPAGRISDDNTGSVSAATIPHAQEASANRRGSLALAPANLQQDRPTQTSKPSSAQAAILVPDPFLAQISPDFGDSRASYDQSEPADPYSDMEPTVSPTEPVLTRRDARFTDRQLPSMQPIADAPLYRARVEPAPTVRVTIGRIEIRAAMPPDLPPRTAPPRRRAALPLDQYLQQRNEGRR